MWEVPKNNLKVELPEGFRLMEDEYSVYLFYGQDRVAVFSSVGVEPGKIEEAAQQHLTTKEI